MCDYLSSAGDVKVSSERKLYKDVNLQVLFLVALIAIMGVSSITPAFPRIVMDLGLSPQDVGMLITAFTLPGVFLAPVLGVLADRVGRRRILVPSLFLFGIAGFACFFSGDFGLLLVLRFFQGIGGASLGLLHVTIIGDLYPGKEGAAVLGYNSSVQHVGTAVYPSIGGALALIGWSYPFILPLLAIPVGLLALFRLKNPEPKSDQKLRDYLGDAVRGMGNRRVLGLILVGVFLFIVMYGCILTYLTFLLSDGFGASTFTIGLITSSMAVAVVLASSQVGRLTKRFSEKKLILASLVLATVSLGIIPFVPSLWLFVVPAMIFGTSMGLRIPCVQTLLSKAARLETRGTFMAINSMGLRLGQTLGPLVMGVVFTFWGLDLVFFTGVMFMAALFFMVYVMI
jgi:MFS family permease